MKKIVKISILVFFIFYTGCNKKEKNISNEKIEFSKEEIELFFFDEEIALISLKYEIEIAKTKNILKDFYNVNTLYQNYDIDSLYSKIISISEKK